jgi:glycerophosphoryl diester phosphodiesterase
VTRPQLPRHPDSRPFVLGHRGVPLKAHENTLRSYQIALDDGADGVEIDVRMTSDGALRIAHDDFITFAGHSAPLAMSALSSSQIDHLRLPSGDRVPSLMDALRFQAETGCLLNVEIKGDVPNPSWACARAAAEIGAHGGTGIVLSSFSPLVVKLMTARLPHVPCALLFEASQTWMRRVLPLSPLGAAGAHPEEVCIDENLVNRIKSRNAFVGAWTVNDPGRARQLAALGVDILIGDDPRTLLTALTSA